MKPERHLKPNEFDELPAECWCGRQIVWVPRRLILDCKTLPCGRPTCTPPPS